VNNWERKKQHSDIHCNIINRFSYKVLFKILHVLKIQSYITTFWVTTPRSLASQQRRFRGKCLLSFQALTINQTRNQHEAGSNACLACSSILKMEATYYSRKNCCLSTDYRNHHNYRCENFRSYTVNSVAIISDIEKMQNGNYKKVLINSFNESDDSRWQRDYCWQSHLQAELMLPATSTCSYLSAHCVTIFSRSNITIS
jgi:hypothetical protein